MRLLGSQILKPEDLSRPCKVAPVEPPRIFIATTRTEQSRVDREISNGSSSGGSKLPRVMPPDD